MTPPRDPRVQEAVRCSREILERNQELRDALERQCRKTVDARSPAPREPLDRA